MLTVFDRLQGMAAVGTLELQWGSYFFAVDKGLATDLAFELTAAACIIVDVLMWCTTERTYGVSGTVRVLPFWVLAGLTALP